jgi:hypothetical protein
MKDLDVKPINPNTILAGNLGDSAVYMQEALGKIYASFILPGQGGGKDDNNGPDIAAQDPNFTTITRSLWNLQEITTDEAICGWGDAGIADLNTQTWSSTNQFLTALYQRLSLSITYANDFIRTTNGNSDPKVIRYNAEARFLRALAYYYSMDLFGNPPFTTDADGVGKFFPKQIERAKLFNYIVSELHGIEDKLGDISNSTQASKSSCWMLLARVYLNAEVYTGTAKWDSCKIYCDKVISSGKFSLAPNYRKNFSADNDRSHNNPEMIFAIEQDGVHTQGYVGTTFIIESSSDAVYLRAEDFHDLTSNTNWNGNRSRKDFLNVMVDTIATYGNVPIPASDPFFAQCKDKRVYLRMKKSINIPSASSSGDYGVGVYKFTAKNADGSRADNYSPAYASTDFPIFRYADALMMRAEALHNLGNEAQRRTDLVRFGQFTNGSYNWTWKGGVLNGTITDSHLNIFPIPGDEVSANPNIKQNPGYN